MWKNPHVFCFICCMYIVKEGRNSVCDFMKKAYPHYFWFHLWYQDKLWAPHVVCTNWLENWRQWTRSQRKCGVPLVWRESNFLGSNNSGNYWDVVEKKLKDFNKHGCHRSIENHYLHILSILVSNKRGSSNNIHIETIKERYQGILDNLMMTNDWWKPLSQNISKKIL